jgi:ubiquinol-cytochrome c reductase cytochrome c subunit
VSRLFRRWLGRRALLPRRLRIALAVALTAGAVGSVAVQTSGAQSPPSKPPAGGPAPPENPALVARGRTLYVGSCSSCHGLGANGVPGSGPSLHGVGAGAADWYLRTGRMPLPDPRTEPTRGRPHFVPADIQALVAYVGSLGGGPIPHANPAQGSVSEGYELFAEKCAGCHQIAAVGGTVTGARVPDLQKPSPQEIAEAVRTGPYVMPRFSSKDIDQHELDSLARYILYTRHADDRGGWSLGHVGPIPEGIVAWLLGGVALLLITRLIGERLAD